MSLSETLWGEKGTYITDLTGEDTESHWALSCPESESRWGAQTEYPSWFPASQISILPSTLSWAWSVRAAWPPEPSKKLRKHTEKKKYLMTSLICRILKKNDTNKWIYLQKRKRLTDLETYGCQGEGCGKGIVKEFGINMYTLLYLKWITNKDLLYSTWNSAQHYVAAWMGEGFGEEQIHVYTWQSPFAVHHCWTVTTKAITILFIGYTPIQNKKLFVCLFF